MRQGLPKRSEILVENLKQREFRLVLKNYMHLYETGSIAGPCESEKTSNETQRAEITSCVRDGRLRASLRRAYSPATAWLKLSSETKPLAEISLRYSPQSRPSTAFSTAATEQSERIRTRWRQNRVSGSEPDGDRTE